MSSSSKSVKFEISITGLKVSFEGDIQTAERIGGQVTGAFNSLVSAQQKLIGSGSTSTATPPVVPAITRRRGRGRRPSSGGIDMSIIEGATIRENGNGDDAESSVARPRRSTAGGQPLILTLKDEGFFTEKRTLGAVRGQLSAKGHNLKNGDISPALVALTRNRTLKREKHANGQWIYFAD
jgi:hypothetical protein